MRAAIRLSATLAPLLLAACASNPAEDPVQVRLNDLDERLARIERVINNQSLVELSGRIDALEAQTRRQHGDLELLQNGMEGSRTQQRNLYADIDKRIAALEANVRAAGAAAPAVQPPGATGVAGATAGTPDEQSDYARAFDMLKGGDYSQAQAAFRDFLRDHPDGSLADNAQYWIGEAYYVTRDYDHAAEAFARVGERWPDSRKAPDAMLKLGYTQFEQKRYAAARGTLQQVVDRYARFPPEAH